MGTEILVVFIPVPLLFWLWNIKQIMNKDTRHKGIMLFGGGFLFTLGMLLPIAAKQYLFQGLIYAGMLYLPFYLLLSLVINIGLMTYHRS